MPGDVSGIVPVVAGAREVHDGDVLDVRDLRRSSDGRLLSGVAAGVAAMVGTPPLLVRLVFVVLALVNGAGILLYVGCHLLVPDDTGRRAESSTARAVLLAVVAFVGAAVVEGLGFLSLSGVAVPIALGAVGAMFLWFEVRGDRSEARPPIIEVVRRIVGDEMPRGRQGRIAVARSLVGVSLIIAGLVVFVASSGSIRALGSALGAFGLLALGLMLLVGPSLWRLGEEVIDERTARVRSDERADMAAHLHDSVLQTLTLIQRHPGRADEVARLARRQERELRTWLRNPERPVGHTVGDLIRAVADGVEDDYDVTVDVVLVGDLPADDRIGAVVDAAGEALRNAARHAEVESMSVYAEISESAVEVFVRDRGVGFERAAVPDDRRGIAESIEGRMERIGGEATVKSEPGAGTEVVLRLELIDGTQT